MYIYSFWEGAKLISLDLPATVALYHMFGCLF